MPKGKKLWSKSTWPTTGPLKSAAILTYWRSSLPGVQYKEIIDNGLTITTKEGKRLSLEADTIVTALPLLPNTGLYKSLEGSAPEVHAIGDCREPHLTVDAVADGSRVARGI
jgi:hypothetical protein